MLQICLPPAEAVPGPHKALEHLPPRQTATTLVERLHAVVWRERLPRIAKSLEPVPKRGVGLRCTDLQSPVAAAYRSRNCHRAFQAAIAQRFDVSQDAVWRHGQAHLSPEMRAALATKRLQRGGDMRRILLEEGTGVVEALKAIWGPLFRQFLVAIDTGENKAAAALAAQLHESLALTAKHQRGKLSAGRVFSITNRFRHDEWRNRSPAAQTSF